MKHLVHVVHFLGVEAYLTVDYSVVVHKPRVVVRALQPQVVCVAGEVIKLVHVDAVTSIGDDFEEEIAARVMSPAELWSCTHKAS